MVERSKTAANEVVQDSCMECGWPWNGATLPASYATAWCRRCEKYTRFEAQTYVPKAIARALADALDDLHRYSLVPDHGYAGSPCEAKVRAALEAIGRKGV